MGALHTMGVLHCVWRVQAGVGLDGMGQRGEGRDHDTKDAAGDENPIFLHS